MLRAIEKRFDDLLALVTLHPLAVIAAFVICSARLRIALLAISVEGGQQTPGVVDRDMRYAALAAAMRVGNVVAKAF